LLITTARLCLSHQEQNLKRGGRNYTTHKAPILKIENHSLQNKILLQYGLKSTIIAFSPSFIILLSIDI